MGTGRADTPLRLTLRLNYIILPLLLLILLIPPDSILKGI